MELITKTQVLLSTLALSFISQTTFAQVKEVNQEAIERFKRGIELFEESNYPASLIEFRQAYKISPSYKILYNIGKVCYQLHDYVCAKDSYQTYLLDGSDKIDKERREEVSDELKKAKSRIAVISFSSNEQDVEVSIDDTPIPNKLNGPTAIQVNEGRHKIYAVKNGYIPITRNVEVAGSSETTIDLTLLKLAGTTTVIHTETTSKWNSWSWTGLTTASGLALGAGVTGYFALKYHKDATSTTYVGHIPDSISSSQSKAKAFAITTDVLAGLSILTLGSTLYFTWTRDPVINTTTTQNKENLSFNFNITGVSLNGSF